MPAGFATIRDRSFAGDPDRRLAWLLVAATIPAAIVGVLFNDVIETDVPRRSGSVAVMLVVGAVDPVAGRPLAAAPTAGVDDVTFPIALGIGVAQALALVPGISRSGISISAGRFAGLDREAAARFSFLMATPITAGAGVFEVAQAASGRGGRRRSSSGRSSSGLVAAFVVRAARHRASCCATCGRTRSTSSSSTGSCWPRSSSSSWLTR